MSVQRILVLGGARSGKSRYAQGLAETCGCAPIYVATAQAFDDEMRERIARHQSDRDARWRTCETTLDLAETIAGVAGEGRVVLVDCLTLWLSNLMLADHDIEAAVTRLCACAAQSAGRLVFVSNEVGSGIVPESALGRRFRDEKGRLNQRMAEICEVVVLVTAGLAMQLKPAPPPTLAGWDAR